jgi:hypothetical protein
MIALPPYLGVLGESSFYLPEGVGCVARPLIQERWVRVPHAYTGVLGECPAHLHRSESSANLPQGAGKGAIVSSVYLGCWMCVSCPIFQLPEGAGYCPAQFTSTGHAGSVTEHLPQSAAAPPIYKRVLGECLFPIYLGMLDESPTNSSHLFAAAGNNVEDTGG